MRRAYLIASLALVLVIAALAQAATRLVPDEYATIQTAIDDANNGDEIIISPGVYCENVSFKGKNITLRSIKPSSPTIVSQTIVSAGGTIINVNSGGKVSGFTIRNYSREYTDGINCSRFSLIISHCVIMVSGNGIRGNIPYQKPASQPIIENNIIYGRRGVYLFAQASAQGGVNAIIRNNVIVGDYSDYSIGISYRTSKSLPVLTGNIVTGFDTGIDFTYDSLEEQRKRLIRYNNVWGNNVNYKSQGIVFDLTGIQGNISEAPLFLNFVNRDFHLMTSSPCKDAGDPNFIPDPNSADLDGEPRLLNSRVDIGVDEISDSNLMPISLYVLGSNEVVTNSAQQYTAIADFNSYSVDVTQKAVWTVQPETYANIDSNGLLSTDDVNEIFQVTIHVQLGGIEYLHYEELVSVFPPQIVYVPSDYDTIQAALDAARNHDTVIVTDATYSGEGNYNLDFKGKNLVLRSENGPNDCIIDCRQKGRGFYFHRAENSSSIVSGFTIKNGYTTRGGSIYSHSCSPQIIGCNIVNNSADNYGGAIYIYSGSPTISKCTIKHNLVDGPDEKIYGGGIFGEYTNLIVRDSIISENSIMGGVVSSYWGNRIYGAAISAIQSKADLSGCIITNNIAQGRLDSKSNVHGGAVCLGDNSDSSRIVNCSISENKAIASRSVEGAGINLIHGTHFHILDCNINSNLAKGKYVESAGVFIMNVFPAHINNSVICNNVGLATDRCSGAGLCLIGDVNLYNADVSGNIAKGENESMGGGIFMGEMRSPRAFVNCKITGNSTTQNGGAIFLSSMYGPRNEIMLNLQNCTLADNIANQNGGAIYYFSECHENNFKILNSILCSNVAQKGADIYVARPKHTRDPCTADAIDIAYSDIGQSEFNIYVEDPTYLKINWQEGNSDADPCFIEPGYWDVNGVWVDGDYHLKSKGWSWDIERGRWTYDDVTSRCIDAGNPGSPLGDELLCIPDDPNNIWGQNLRINMGAYGGTAEASMPPYDWAILGDLTNDGLVNLEDFAFQAADWLNSADQQPGDLNRDSLIGISDLVLLVEDWLKQTTWHE